MSRLETVLRELKLAADSPEIYLANFFRELQNQIDLECEAFLNRANVSDRDKGRAIQQQIQMINEVDLFQRKCLANLTRIPIGPERVEHGHANEKDFYRALFKRQKLLFMNQGVIFFNNKNFDQFLQVNLHFYLLSFKYENPLQLFGLLIFIEDEFLIYSDKTNLMLE